MGGAFLRGIIVETSARPFHVKEHFADGIAVKARKTRRFGELPSIDGPSQLKIISIECEIRFAHEY